MSATWRIGKVEEVKIGADGYVRQARIAYKDTSGSDNASDWVHRTVERPVRNIVKLFHIEDTTLMDEIQAIHKHSKKLLEEEEMSFDDENFETIEKTFPSPSIEVEAFDEEPVSKDERRVTFDENVDVCEYEETFQDFDEFDQELKNSRRKLPKKRKTELERLKIDMEGWNMIKKTDVDDIKSPDPNSLQVLKIAASPFIHNFMLPSFENTSVQGNQFKEPEEGYSMRLGMGEVAEIEDEDFNVVSKDNSFDSNENAIYML